LAEGAWCDSSEDISDGEHFDHGILKEVTQFSSAAETVRALEEVVEEFEGANVDTVPAGDIALSGLLPQALTDNDAAVRSLPANQTYKVYSPNSPLYETTIISGKFIVNIAIPVSSYTRSGPTVAHRMLNCC